MRHKLNKLEALIPDKLWRFMMSAGILFTSLFLMGCFDVDDEFRYIRNITLNECGGNFDVDTEFGLGSFELWIAGGIAAFEDGEASEIIHSISDVQIGIYKRGDHNNIATGTLMKKIDRKLERTGWRFLVKSYQKNHLSAVYLNRNAGRVFRDLFIIDLDEKEMTIVQVSGDLENVIETAIRKEGFSFNKNGLARK